MLGSRASAVTVLPPSKWFGLQTLKLATQSDGLGGAGVPLVSSVPRQGVLVSLDSAHGNIVQLACNPSGHLPAAI